MNRWPLRVFTTTLLIISVILNASNAGNQPRKTRCSRYEQYCPSGCAVGQEIEKFQTQVTDTTKQLLDRAGRSEREMNETRKRSERLREDPELQELRESLATTEQTHQALLVTLQQDEELSNRQTSQIRQLQHEVEELETLLQELEGDTSEVETQCPPDDIEETESTSSATTSESTSISCRNENCNEADQTPQRKNLLSSNCDVRMSVVKSDCAAFYHAGHRESGVYFLRPQKDSPPFKAYCDMDTSGGGWTVVQRRTNGNLSFDKDWSEYKLGFGEARDYCSGEFWLGNEQLKRLTRQFQTVRFEMTNWEDRTRVAQYLYFKVNPESSKYRIQISVYNEEVSNASDSIAGGTYAEAQRRNFNNMYFTTRDRDNDRLVGGNCAQFRKSQTARGAPSNSSERQSGSGGWWYNECHAGNLNGKYYRGGYYTPDTSAAGMDGDGIVWTAWMGPEYSLKKTEIKLRPTNFR